MSRLGKARLPVLAALVCLLDVPAHAQRVENAIAVFAALDKVTAPSSNSRFSSIRPAISARSRSRRAPATRALRPSRRVPPRSWRSTR